MIDVTPSRHKLILGAFDVNHIEWSLYVELLERNLGNSLTSRIVEVITMGSRRFTGIFGMCTGGSEITARKIFLPEFTTESYINQRLYRV